MAVLEDMADEYFRQPEFDQQLFELNARATLPFPTVAHTASREDSVMPQLRSFLQRRLSFDASENDMDMSLGSSPPPAKSNESVSPLPLTSSTHPGKPHSGSHGFGAISSYATELQTEVQPLGIVCPASNITTQEAIMEQQPEYPSRKKIRASTPDVVQPVGNRVFRVPSSSPSLTEDDLPSCSLSDRADDEVDPELLARIPPEQVLELLRKVAKLLDLVVDWTTTQEHGGFFTASLKLHHFNILSSIEETVFDSFDRGIFAMMSQLDKEQKRAAAYSAIRFLMTTQGVEAIGLSSDPEINRKILANLYDLIECHSDTVPGGRQLSRNHGHRDGNCVLPRPTSFNIAPTPAHAHTPAHIDLTVPTSAAKPPSVASRPVPSEPARDWVSDLNLRAQKLQLRQPDYAYVESAGPRFNCTVLVVLEQNLGGDIRVFRARSGQHSSKAAAKSAAARQALREWDKNQTIPAINAAPTADLILDHNDEARSAAADHKLSLSIRDKKSKIKAERILAINKLIKAENPTEQSVQEACKSLGIVGPVFHIINNHDSVFTGYVEFGNSLLLPDALKGRVGVIKDLDITTKKMRKAAVSKVARKALEELLKVVESS